MAAYPRKKITISLLIPFLVFVLFFSILIWQKYRSSHEIPVINPHSNTEGSRSVTLFFSADGVRLAREARVLDQCESDNDCLKDVLDELLNGPVGELMEAIPEGTTVNFAGIDGDQATIDFNHAFFDAMLSGSSAEMLAVYSVVNTVAVNFPQVQKIKIDIDGNKHSLLHHLDLSDPLQPDFSLEQLPAQDSEKVTTESTTNRKGASQ